MLSFSSCRVEVLARFLLLVAVAFAWLLFMSPTAPRSLSGRAWLSFTAGAALRVTVHWVDGRARDWLAVVLRHHGGREKKSEKNARAVWRNAGESGARVERERGVPGTFFFCDHERVVEKLEKEF